QEVSPEPGLDIDDSGFDAEHRHEQCLMDGDANSEEEEGSAEISALVWRINPADQTEHEHHDPRNTEQRNAVNSHRFTPHHAAQTEQDPGDDARDQADGILPFAFEFFEFLDAFHEHAAAARNHKGDQGAGHGCGHGFTNLNPPGHIADRK